MWSHGGALAKLSTEASWKDVGRHSVVVESWRVTTTEYQLIWARWSPWEKQSKKKRRRKLSGDVMLLRVNASCSQLKKKLQVVILECGFQPSGDDLSTLQRSDAKWLYSVQIFEETFAWTSIFRQMLCHGWKDKILTSTWPEYHHSQHSGTRAQKA